MLVKHMEHSTTKLVYCACHYFAQQAAPQGWGVGGWGVADFDLHPQNTGD